MKTNISKIGKSLILIIFAITFFYSCKKNDIKNEEVATNSTEADKATIDRVKNAIVSNGKSPSTSMIINQPVSDVYFSDANNNRIDLRKLLSGSTPYTAVCDYQYDPNGDPIDDMFPSDYQLNSIGFFFDCSPIQPNEYRLSFDWSLAVHHLILPENNYGVGGGFLRSRYTLKVKNSAGTVIATYTNNLILGGNITDFGDWSVDPTRKFYGITASLNIPASIFDNGVTYETTVTLATNCNLTPQLSASNTITSINSVNSLPCKRTDKVWITPGTGPGGIANAAGTYVVCSPSSGFTVTTNHDLEYRLRNIAVDSWDSQTSTVYSVSPFSTYTGVVNLAGTGSGSGTYLIRYRNNNSCSPSAPWFLEKWIF